MRWRKFISAAGLILGITVGSAMAQNSFLHMLQDDNANQYLYQFRVNANGEPLLVFLHDVPGTNDTIVAAMPDLPNDTLLWTSAIVNYNGTSTSFLKAYPFGFLFGTAGFDSAFIYHIANNNNTPFSLGVLNIGLPSGFNFDLLTGSSFNLDVDSTLSYILFVAAVNDNFGASYTYLATYNISNGSLIADTMIRNTTSGNMSVEDVLNVGTNTFLFTGVFNDWNNMAWETYIARVTFDPLSNTFIINPANDIITFDYTISPFKLYRANIPGVGTQYFFIADSVGATMILPINLGVQISLGQGVKLYRTGETMQLNSDIIFLHADTAIIGGSRIYTTGGNTEYDVAVVWFNPNTGQVHFAANYDHTQFDYFYGVYEYNNSLITAMRHLDGNNDYDIMLFSIHKRLSTVEFCQIEVTRTNLLVSGSQASVQLNSSPVYGSLFQGTNQSGGASPSPVNLQPFSIDYVDGTYDITFNISVTEPTTCVSTDGSITFSATGSPIGNYVYYDSTYNIITSPLQNLSAGIYTIIVRDGNNCQVDTQIVLNAQNGPDTISTSIQPASCYGSLDGSISVVVNNCTNCSYQWTDANNNVVGQGSGVAAGDTLTISNLPAGTYTLTLSEASCTFIATFTVGQPQQLNATISTQDASSCTVNDGSAQIVSITGGTSPYTINWYDVANNNIGSGNLVSNLAPGTYMVVITDANGCTFTDSFVISAPNIPSITAVNIQDALCNGDASGSIDVTVNCPSGNCSFQWSGPGGFSASTEDISNIGAGVYTLTITDNTSGCTYTDSFIVTEPSALVIQDSIMNVSCYGGSDGSIDITVYGGTPQYQYAWTGPNNFSSNNEDIQGLVAGTYVVTVTDANGCTYTDSFTVTEPPQLTVSISQSGNTLTANASGGTPPYSFSWNTGDTSSSMTVSSSGTYIVTVTDANGCSAQDTIIITSSEVPTTNAQCLLAQSRNSLNITCYEPILNIAIFDMTGKQVMYRKAKSQTTSLHLQPGIYVIQITTTKSIDIKKVHIQ